MQKNDFINEVERQKSDSAVLNSNSARFKFSPSLGDLQSVRNLLFERVGDSNGKIQQRKYLYPAALPQAKLDVKKIENDFADYQIKMMNEGKAKPAEMPRDMAEKHMKAKAKIEVIKLEVSKLQKLEKQLDIKQDEQRNREKPLAYGPIGSGTLQGGVLTELDGQKVEKDSEGVLRINDKLSPYNGLKTAVYLDKVVKQYHKSQRDKATRLRIGKKANRKDLPKMQKEWLQE